MDEDIKGQRKMEDTGRGLLPAEEGHNLEKDRIEYSAGPVPHCMGECGRVSHHVGVFLTNPTLCMCWTSTTLCG